MPARRTNRLLLTAAAALGIAAGAAGIAGAVTTGSGADPAPTVPRAEAERAATAAVPGTVTESEHEGDDGPDLWTVEIRDAEGRTHEVLVDASDGAVLASGLDDDDRDDDSRADDDRDGPEGDPALASSAAVTQAAAEATATAEAPGTVHRTEIEREDGRVVWDVEVDGTDGLRHDVVVDATTGAVLEHDVED